MLILATPSHCKDPQLSDCIETFHCTAAGPLGPGSGSERASSRALLLLVGLLNWFLRVTSVSLWYGFLFTRFHSLQHKVPDVCRALKYQRPPRGPSSIVSSSDPLSSVGLVFAEGRKMFYISLTEEERPMLLLLYSSQNFQELLLFFLLFQPFLFMGLYAVERCPEGRSH